MGIVFGQRGWGLELLFESNMAFVIKVLHDLA